MPVLMDALTRFTDWEVAKNELKKCEPTKLTHLLTDEAEMGGFIR